MKKLINFEDYLFDKIFESASKKETSVIISDRLFKLLDDNISHPIAFDLLEINNIDTDMIGNKVTLIDYDEKDPGKFTYTIPSKLRDYIEKELPNYNNDLNTYRGFNYLSAEQPELWNKFRNSTTIGKVINKLWPNKYKPNGDPGKDIESFSNDIKMERRRSEEIFDRFKIVSGDDIIHYYNENQYDPRAFHGSNLGGSCMRYSHCSNYIDFYAKNSGVKLVILMSDNEEEENNDKIVGRAVLWDIASIDGEKVNRKFMDRIYYIDDTIMRLFKEFAKRNKWMYKEKQNMFSETRTVDTIDDSVSNRSLETVSTFKETGEYPYMDSMKYYYHYDGDLTNVENDDGDAWTLESTNGEYEEHDGIYVEFYGENYPEEDLIFCELGTEYRLPDDAFLIDSLQEYATQEYIDDNLVWSDYENEYIDRETATFSDYYDDWIMDDNIVDVFKAGEAKHENIKDVEEDEIEPRMINDKDDNFFTYNSNYLGTVYFDEKDLKYFDTVFSLKSDNNVYAHKNWDKDKIFKYDNKLYLNDDQEAKDKLIGQKRIW